MKTSALGVLASLFLANVVRAQTLGDPATTASAFGGRGQVAISSDFNLSFVHHSHDVSELQLKPALDYFIAPQLSIGGDLLFDYRGNSGSSETRIGIGPRVGYDIPLGPMFSLFLRGGFRVTHATASTTIMGISASTSGNYLTLDLSGEFLFHPVPHFFIGLGPTLLADLAGGNSQSRDVAVGLESTVGGYFDW